MAMILELAGVGPDLIYVTAQYSNAVLVALLPHFSDVAHKLDLPVPQPITAQHVVESGIMPFRYPNGDMLGGGVEVKGGWSFSFMNGYVNVVQSKHCYSMLQNPDELPNYFGEVRMSREDAVGMARDTIKKLDIPLEVVFAEQEPQVTLPVKIGTNTVPHYLIEWFDPRGGSRSVTIEANADAKRVERIFFGVGAGNLHRTPPKIDVDVKTPMARVRPQANPDYAWKLIPIVLRAVDDYAKTLNLPVPRPLTTNRVARFSLSDNGGWPHSVLELTNGWQFVYRNSMVNGYYAPDNLFWFPRKGQRTLIKDYVGKWNMTEPDAIELIRQTLAKLNYPTNLVHMDFAPKVLKPVIPGIPRYFFTWEYLDAAQTDIESKVEAEVDADSGKLKSFYYDDKAFWNKPPPIDVPISVPVPKGTNSTVETHSRRPQGPITKFAVPGKK